MPNQNNIDKASEEIALFLRRTEIKVEVDRLLTLLNHIRKFESSSAIKRAKLLKI